MTSNARTASAGRSSPTARLHAFRALRIVGENNQVGVRGSLKKVSTPKNFNAGVSTSINGNVNVNPQVEARQFQVASPKNKEFSIAQNSDRNFVDGIAGASLQQRTVAAAVSRANADPVNVDKIDIEMGDVSVPKQSTNYNTVQAYPPSIDVPRATV